jgi:hypothetical protein
MGRLLEKIEGKPEDRPKSNVAPIPGVKGEVALIRRQSVVVACGLSSDLFVFFPEWRFWSFSLWERIMHIMEGFLPIEHAVGWSVASAPFVAYGIYAVKNASAKIRSSGCCSVWRRRLPSFSRR